MDPGFGTAYMARVIGEKRAREVWYLCRQYTAAEAVQMGLANKAVPDDELDAEVDRWCAEILEKSPTAHWSWPNVPSMPIPLTSPAFPHWV